MKAWLKGGIIGGGILGGIGLLIVLLDFLWMCGAGTNMGDPCGFFIFYASFPLIPFFMNLKINPIYLIISMGISILILYFTIGFIPGSIIGLIVQKIKSRKQNLPIPRQSIPIQKP